MSGEPTSVYVISCGDLVKIGVSKNPTARQRALQTPQQPRLVATREVPSREQAYALELRLHRLFARQRAHGEWFRVTAGLAAKALKNINYHGDGHSASKLIRDAFDAMHSEPELFR